MKIKAQNTQNSWETMKEVWGGQFRVLSAHIKKTKKAHIRDLTISMEHSTQTKKEYTFFSAPSYESSSKKIVHIIKYPHKKNGDSSHQWPNFMPEDSIKKQTHPKGEEDGK